jgi:hypothetical protein
VRKQPVFADELFHATIAWGRRAKFNWKRLGDDDCVNADEERITHVHGRLCRAFVQTGEGRWIIPMKKHGRRTPYTEIGIRRLPCVRCGAKPSIHQFQICADGRKYRPVCVECDIALNVLVCEFLQLPGHRRRLAQYAKASRREATR